MNAVSRRKSAGLLIGGITPTRPPALQPLPLRSQLPRVPKNPARNATTTIVMSVASKAASWGRALPTACSGQMHGAITSALFAPPR